MGRVPRPLASPATVLLNDPFILPRAWRYTSPDSEAAVLPVVYGDLTDGVSGIWELPRIDTTPGAMVFAFAGHPVLSVADGNSVTLYDGAGVVIPGGNYTFNEDDDRESKGRIATCAFTVDPVLPVIAGGKGKNTGSTLIDNPITIVEDALVNVVGLGTSAAVFESSALEDARERAAAAAYKAAGVLTEDFTPGEAIQKILANFMGTWFQRVNRKVSIFLETELATAGALPFGEAMQAFILERDCSAVRVGPRRREEIINRPAATYRFNFSEAEFKGFDDGTVKEDGKSVGVHGALGRPAGPFEMDWIRDLTTLQTVQGVVVSLLKDGPRVFEVSISGRADRFVGLERGDYVSLSLDFVQTAAGSPLTNQICRVLSKSYEHEAGVLTLRLYDTGFFLTDPCPADGTCVADGSRTAGNDRDLVKRA